MPILTTPKGTTDILPADMPTWDWVETTAKRIFGQAGFNEIRTPMFEVTELFERGVGEGTDIVNKEMYTFEKSDRRLTLRPENTAGVVRAYIENGMDRWPKPVKLFYVGPMFRYERPQKGRQRQFNQIGIELFGLDSAQADAEVIAIAMQLFESLGLTQLSLDINNVGCFTCRADFRNQLVTVLTPYKAQLCEDCQRRLETNPLRMLDCKNASCQAIFAQPDVQTVITGETTCGECQAHFNQLLSLLDGLNIAYKRNPMLVRGLDYYTRTVFEIQSSDLGAQNTVCGGGRYNGLVKSLGGNDTPAVGWALGVERLVSLIQPQSATTLDYFVASQSPDKAMALVQQLRRQGFRAECDLSDGKKALGKQLEQAGKLNAAKILILGETELSTNQITLKDRSTGEQTTVALDSLIPSLQPN